MGLVRAYVVSAMAWEMDLWVVGDASKGNFVPRDAKQLDAGVEVDVWWVVFLAGDSELRKQVTRDTRQHALGHTSVNNNKTSFT